jgi:hypothetical protein
MSALIGSLNPRENEGNFMSDNDNFGFKGTTLTLMVSSLLLTLSQMISTSWCNANSSNFGYFLDEKNDWHICVYDMPGSWLFRYGALGLTSLGIMNLFTDVFKTRATWLETKTVNLSRAGLILGMVSVNGLLEILNSAWLRPETKNFLYFFYDNFFYFFPVALALVVVSSWSIVNKVELIFTLNKRRR